MRHDPAGAAIIIMLRSLKMPGMAQAVHDLMEQGAPAFEAAMPMLSQLLKAEMAEREVRSISYHMKAAVQRENDPLDRFLVRLTPAYKDLSGFDFAASEINETLVRQLHRCAFMDAAENVVLIGDEPLARHWSERQWRMEPGKATLRPPLAFRPSSITANACASSPP